MSESIRQIALRISELREISGLSAEALSAELGIDSQTYADYESGSSDIPVGVLMKISRRFNVDLTDILTGGSPHLHEYCLVRRGKGVKVERRKAYEYQSLAYNYVHKKAEPFLVTVPVEPDDAPFPLSSHPGQEFTFVISGTLKLMVNGHELTLNEGDSLFFDSGFDHGMKAAGGQPAEFLAIIF